MVITLEGYDVGGDANHIGYDIYRQTVADCGDAIRVNDEPLSRQIDTWYVVEFVDRGAVEGALYRYQIFDVDDTVCGHLVAGIICVPVVHHDGHILGIDNVVPVEVELWCWSEFPHG